MGFWTVWWAWFIAALVFGILEITVPAYIFLGFAIGALGMAIITLVGITGFSLPVALVIWAVLSLIAYIGMRQFFKMDRGQVKTWDTDIND